MYRLELITLVRTSLLQSQRSKQPLHCRSRRSQVNEFLSASLSENQRPTIFCAFQHFYSLSLYINSPCILLRSRNHKASPKSSRTEPLVASCVGIDDSTGENRRQVPRLRQSKTRLAKTGLGGFSRHQTNLSVLFFFLPFFFVPCKTTAMQCTVILYVIRST